MRWPSGAAKTTLPSWMIGALTFQWLFSFGLYGFTGWIGGRRPGNGCGFGFGGATSLFSR